MSRTGAIDFEEVGDLLLVCNAKARQGNGLDNLARNKVCKLLNQL